MGTLRYGTSSWSEKSWEGIFYPAGLKPAQYLASYASRFDTVEADSTYYRAPSPAMVMGWRERTPDGFVLSAKFPRAIVHGGAREQPDPARLLLPEHTAAEVERFLAAMAFLGPKCGPLVLQFPYFNRATFSAAGPFLERLEGFLGRLPGQFRYAVEIHNKAWVTGELLGLLRAKRTAFVLVDLLYMPHPADLATELELITTDFSYARLIGDRKAVEAQTKTFDRIVIDQSSRLARWAHLLRDVAARTAVTFVYANNHYAGHGPATVAELRRRVEGGEEPPPCTTG